MFGFLKGKLNKFFVKFLFVLIALSFVFLGFTDNLQYSNNKGLIYSENKDLSVQEFNRNVENFVSSFRLKAVGKSFTKADILKNPMMLQTLLLNALNTISLDNYASDLNITMSDEQAYEVIRATDQFKDIDGKFDYEIFSQIINRMGVSEQAFIQDVKKQNASSLAGALMSFSTLYPRPFINSFIQNMNEIRDVKEVSLNFRDVKLTENATDVELENVYKSNIDMFKTKELKDVAVIYTNKDLVNSKTEAGAYKAIEMTLDDLIGGASLDEISAKADIKVKRFSKVNSAGFYGEKNLSDKLISKHINDIFTLGENDESEIIEDNNDLIIFYVYKNYDSQPIPFADVKDKVHNLWKIKKQTVKAYEELNKVKIAVNNGAKFEDAVKDNSLSFKKLSIDKRSKELESKYYGNKGDLNIVKMPASYHLVFIEDIKFPENTLSKEELLRQRLIAEQAWNRMQAIDKKEYLFNKYDIYLNEKSLEEYLNMF